MNTSIGKIPRHTIPSDNAGGVFVRHLGALDGKQMDFEVHCDDYYVMAMVVQSKAAISRDFHEIVLTAGDAIIIEPQQVHVGHWAMPDTEGWLLAIAPEHLSAAKKEAVSRYCLTSDVLTLDPRTASDVTALFNMAFRNQGNSEIFRSLTIAVKNFIIAAIPPSASNTIDRYARIVIRLKRLIEDNMRDVRKPSAYASMLNISEGYLNEAVKATTGMSVTEFIRHNVIVRAKRMIAYTSLTSQEIAYELGFDDYAYFSRLFRKETGMSPNAFRKNLELSK